MSGGNNGKELTVSRKTHYPIETLYLCFNRLSPLRLINLGM